MQHVKTHRTRRRGANSAGGGWLVLPASVDGGALILETSDGPVRIQVNEVRPGGTVRLAIRAPAAVGIGREGLQLHRPAG